MRLLQDHASENADNYEDEAQNNEDVSKEDIDRQEQEDEKVYIPTPNSEQKQHSDESFVMKFYAVQKKLGCDTAVRLFSSDSFCRRVEEPGFLAKLLEFIEQLGQVLAVRLFSSNSFCCRVEEPGFLAKLLEFIELLGQVVASRLLKVERRRRATSRLFGRDMRRKE